IYHASQAVHRTRDEGKTWERISPDLTAFDPEKQGISGRRDAYARFAELDVQLKDLTRRSVEVVP
ncbi:MAG: hypothetical protein ACK6AH_13545, partial [Gemmatimonadota bacterium]